MKQLIKIVTIVLVVGLLCFDVLQGSSAAIDTPSIRDNQQVSEAELTKRFNSIFDTELSGENVCLTVSAAHQLNELMTTSAQKIISEKAFNRVGEAETNIRRFAKALMKNATQSGRTRITTETIGNIMATEPPMNTGGAGDTDAQGRVFCPLFPIC